MYAIRPIPHRAFQAPRVSAKVKCPEMTGARPAGVSIQRMKPGTFSLISPLTAGVFGPQQGGFSVDGSKFGSRLQDAGISLMDVVPLEGIERIIVGRLGVPAPQSLDAAF